MSDAAQRPEHTSGNLCLIAAGDGGLSILDAEQRFPVEAADERLAEPV